MSAWLFYSFLTVSVFSLWGIFAKLASRYFPPQVVIFISSTTVFLMLPLYFFLFRDKVKLVELNFGIIWSVLLGIVGSVGTLLFYLAISKGEASRTVAITASYPMLTLMIAVPILSEQLTSGKIVGTALTVIGIYLISK